MDPNACLKRWRDAIASKDSEESDNARRDLATWLGRGGFQPEGLTVAERVSLTLTIPHVVKGSTVRV
jgi:hypothetical protein